jgi:hypothetical protein
MQISKPDVMEGPQRKEWELKRSDSRREIDI